MALKIKPIPIAIQALNIKRLFSETKVTTIHDQQLTWVHDITPSPLGNVYKVKVFYNLTKSPKIYVVSPKPLQLAKGKNTLPHCYDQQQQQLCLFYPSGEEWNKSMLISTTIIPWAFEWLYHYEIWLGTGIWHGGGIHNVSIAEKLKQETNDSGTSDKK